MFCIKCGSQIAEGSKFCGNCGAPQHSAVPEENVLEKGYEEIIQRKEEAQNTPPSLNLPPQTEYELPKKLNEDNGRQSTYQTQVNNASDNFFVQSSPNTNYRQYQSAPVYNSNGNNTQYPNYYASQKKSKGKTIGIIIAVALFVAALALAGQSFFGGSSPFKSGYGNPYDLIEAYFDAVESGKSNKITALMPADWVKDVCNIEGYSNADEFLCEYEYATNMGYMGKHIDDYYIDEYYTKHFNSSELEAVNNFYSPQKAFDGVTLYYADVEFEDGASVTFGIYVAEISGKYYIINTY